MWRLPKIWQSSQKINSAKKVKDDLFDLTIEVSIMVDLNKPYVENLKLLNQKLTNITTQKLKKKTG